MPIKKAVYREADVTRAKRMRAEGYSPGQISNALSVVESVVNYMLDGSYDKDMAKHKKRVAEGEKRRKELADTQKEREAAAMGEAIAGALSKVTQQAPVQEQPGET